MKLGKLLEGENFRITHPEFLNQEINHWTDRSSEVKENSWFIAVRGASSDGHRFIEDALSRGASGLILETPFFASRHDIPQIIVPNSRRLLSSICSRWFGQPSQKLHLIGVTGTNGKTTTTYLVQYVLNSFIQAGLIGTVEALWKDQRVSTMNTTPGPRELNELLNRMVNDGVTCCAMEVSSHALKQERVNQIHFQTAVFTNLTQDHLDYHKTFEDYFESKARLFKDFSSVSRRIINVDDPYGQKLWNLMGKNNSRTSYGVKQAADYRATDIKMSLEETRFTLSARGKKFNVTTKLLCLHNVYNLLASIAIIAEMGYPLKEILQSVSQFEGVPGRLERFQLPNGALVFVDYAHSPDAFINIYTSLKPLKRGRLISVFGCGGNRDRQKRPQMGRIAQENSDWTIITSDNPRNENPKEIIAEILAGTSEKSRDTVDVIEDRREAIQEALDRAKKDDMVLILGKGHEDYQIIGKEKRKFSDQEEIREWVRLHTTPHHSKNLLGV